MSKRILLTLCICVLCGWMAAGRTNAGQTVIPEDPATVMIRIGTFNRTRLLVAYYSSETHASWLRELVEQRNQAVEDGDRINAKEIEAKGAAAQELAHRQLAGDAPMTDILAHIKAQFPQIAQDTAVDVIVEQPIFHSIKVELVDLSDVLAAKFEPARKKGADQ